MKTLGFIGLFGILQYLTHNYILSLALVFIIYLVIDRIYLGFVTDPLLAPLHRFMRKNQLSRDLAVNPHDAQKSLELAMITADNRRFAAALELLDRAEPKMQDSPWVKLYQGICHAELGNTAEAKAALEKSAALDRKAGYGLPYLYLLKLELRLDNPDHNKIEELETELSKYTNAENCYRMALVYRKAGLKEKAGGQFRKALAEYSAVPGRLKRLHRKWAFYSLVNINRVLSALIAASVLTALVTASIAVSAAAARIPHMGPATNSAPVIMDE